MHPTWAADMYIATRTTGGWVTTLPGLTASETGRAPTRNAPKP